MVSQFYECWRSAKNIQMQNKTFVDCRLCSRDKYLLVFVADSAKQNSVGIVQKFRLLYAILSPLGEYMTNHRVHYGKIWRHPKKPEVHNVSQSQWHQKMVEQRPQTACTKICRSLTAWFLRYGSGQTNRHAYDNISLRQWSENTK